jgi:hypothetical protein
MGILSGCWHPGWLGPVVALELMMNCVQRSCRFVSHLFLAGCMVLSAALGAQTLIVSPAIVNFGTHLVGTAPMPFVLSLRNDLGQVAPATIQGYAGLTFAPSVTQTGGTCPATLPFVLAVGAACTISLTFAPTYPVAVSSTFDVVTDAGTLALPVTARGIDNAPLPTIIPPRLDFGQGGAYPSPVLPVTITNPGAAPLDLLGWTGAPSNSLAGSGGNFTVMGGSCMQRVGIVIFYYTIVSPLPAGASCTMVVAFTPPGFPAATPYAGTLVLQTGGGDVSVPLTGVKGPLGQAISPLPSILGFGNHNVGSTGQALLTLSNGADLSTVYGIDLYFTNPSPISVTAGNCAAAFPFALAAGASCTVQLSFAPVAAGVQGAQIRVRADTGNFAVDVVAIGVQPPSVSLRPPAVTFSGTATAFEARTITVTNLAGAATTVSGVALPPNYFSIGTTGTCGTPPFTLQPAASCTFDINRVPGAAVGTVVVSTASGSVDLPVAVASGGVVAVNLATSPAGLRLKVNGQLVPTPVSLQVASGANIAVEAVSQNLSTSGYAFASWSDSGAAAHTLTAPLAGGNFTATFTPTTWVPKLDVDNDGIANAATDGVLILRYLLGFRGAALTAGLAIPAGAERRTPSSIVAYLDQIVASLDIDGAVGSRASTDGLLIYRYLAGKTGVTLFGGAPAPGPRTPAQMTMVLDALLP